jgi:hypothetical protein
MKILHKLKSHQDTINTLCWFPKRAENRTESDSVNRQVSSVSSEICQNNQNGQDVERSELIESQMKRLFSTSELSAVLCSSSADKSIRFWCTSSGAQLLCLDAPHNSSSQSRQKKQLQKQQFQQPQQQQTIKIAYTPLCWPMPRFILSGSYKCDAAILCNSFSSPSYLFCCILVDKLSFHRFSF